MFRLVSLLLIFFMIGCTSTRTMTKTVIRDVVVESDSAEFNTEIDLANPVVSGAYVWETYEIDSEMIDVRIPKKIKFQSHPQTIRIDDNVSVDVVLDGVVDSGIVKTNFKVNRVAYRESTIVKETTKTVSTGSDFFMDLLAKIVSPTAGIVVTVLILAFLLWKFLRK